MDLPMILDAIAMLITIILFIGAYIMASIFVIQNDRQNKKQAKKSKPLF